MLVDIRAKYEKLNDKLSTDNMQPLQLIPQENNAILTDKPKQNFLKQMIELLRQREKRNSFTIALYN